MQSKSSKIFLGIVVIVIAFVAGGYVGKLVFDENTTASGPQSSINSEQNQPKKVDQLTTVLTQPEKYLDKEVTVRGTIYKLDQNEYYLVEQVKKPSKDTPNSIKLDLSKTKIDPSQYANAGSTTKKKNDAKAPEIKPAVTVTGKIISTQTAGRFVLVVSSIKS